MRGLEIYREMLGCGGGGGWLQRGPGFIFVYLHKPMQVCMYVCRKERRKRVGAWLWDGMGIGFFINLYFSNSTRKEKKKPSFLKKRGKSKTYHISHTSS